MIRLSLAEYDAISHAVAILIAQHGGWIGACIR